MAKLSRERRDLKKKQQRLMNEQGEMARFRRVCARLKLDVPKQVADEEAEIERKLAENLDEVHALS